MKPTQEVIINTTTEHRRKAASGEWLPRPGLDKTSMEVLKLEERPTWKEACELIFHRYTNPQKLEPKFRKYQEYHKQYLLNPDYETADDPLFGKGFVSDWKVERQSPLIEVRDHIVVENLTQEERWGLDQYLIQGHHFVKVTPGMFADTKEEISELAVPESGMDEYEILVKMDAIEREMSDYRKQNPKSDLFNETAILNAIGKRKEYAELKRKLDGLEHEEEAPEPSDEEDEEEKE